MKIPKSKLYFIILFAILFAILYQVKFTYSGLYYTRSDKDYEKILDKNIKISQTFYLIPHFAFAEGEESNVPMIVTSTGKIDYTSGDGDTVDGAEIIYSSSFFRSYYYVTGTNDYANYWIPRVISTPSKLVVNDNPPEVYYLQKFTSFSLI